MFFYYNKIVIEFLQQLEVILSHDSVPTSKVCLIVYQYACWNGTHTVLHFDLFTADDACVIGDTTGKTIHKYQSLKIQ